MLEHKPNNDKAQVYFCTSKASKLSTSNYFAQMLEHKPNNYKALEQLILLVRRAGRLHETAAKGGDALRFLKVLTLLALLVKKCTY